MNHLLRAFASTAKKVPYNGRKLQRTVSGLDPQHIASGSYLYKNFIMKQKYDNITAHRKKWIKKLNEKEIKVGYEPYYAAAAPMMCLKKKKSADGVKKDIKSPPALTPEKIKKANKDIFLL
ncbi:hypothetical protein [uncultured Mediterranean phage]|nr:hypothetical protein [uncultured Mediterranean phage]